MSASAPRVVLVPGIMGSRLTSGAGTLWGEDFVANYKQLIANPTLLKWTGTPASASILERVRISRWLPFSFTLWGPTRASLEAAGCEVVGFGYDWRQSLLDSARGLATAITSRSVLVTHSMGGLLARVALGTGRLRPELVSKVIHVGSPTQGAPAAFGALCGALDLPLLAELKAMCFWMDRQTVDRILRESILSFPSIFQLLPQGYACLRAGADWHDPLDEDVLTAEQKRWASESRVALDDGHVIIAGAPISVSSLYTASLKTPRDFHADIVRRPGGTQSWYDNVRVAGDADDGDGTVPAFSAKYRCSREVELRSAKHAWLCASKYVARVIAEHAVGDD